MAGLNLNTIPPTQPVEGVTNTEAQPTETPQVQSTETQPKVEVPPQPEVKADEFIENLNKRFGTSFKADDEIKKTFGLQKTVSEYETKLKESEDIARSNEELKKKLEELEGSQDPLKYFSSPDAYIAEQLKIKYPRSNPDTLHKIATTDLTKMDDLDVLIKDKQLFVPDAPKESVIRSVVLKKYGIDPTTPPEEWDEIAVAEMKLDAAAAREKINGLKSVIEMPKVLTKEQKETMEAEALTEREKALAPIKENFNKFEKFTHKEISGFEFDVPSEYQSKLPDIFKAIFVDAGWDANEEGLQIANELKEALFVHEYLPKLRDIWIKEGETKNQAKVDAELHNTQPPNTVTATDHEDVDAYTGGASKLLSDLKVR